MSERKEIRICKCGHIHIFDETKIDNALQQDKEFILICADCGTAYRIGADREDGEWMGEPGKTFFNMYTTDLHGTTSITAENFNDAENHKPYSEILYNKGIDVPMMSGMNATNWDGRHFDDTWYPDFLQELYDARTTIDDIRKKHEQWQKDRITVNINWMIRGLNNDTAIVLAQAGIPGLDFTGTKYEKYMPDYCKTKRKG